MCIYKLIFRKIRQRIDDQDKYEKGFTLIQDILCSSYGHPLPAGSPGPLDRKIALGDQAPSPPILFAGKYLPVNLLWPGNDFSYKNILLMPTVQDNHFYRRIFPISNKVKALGTNCGKRSSKNRSYRNFLAISNLETLELSF